MCLNPIKLYNHSEYLGKNAPIFIEVPCGHCSECMKAKHTDYCVRSFWQYKEVLSKGGYCYFDTLTYSDQFLPKFYGIPCFSKTHITKFIKDLRRQLDYHLYESKGIKKTIKGQFSYFVSSEYGGKKHRPHYHILFFVSVPELDVLTLKEFINKCWTYGICDSIINAPSRVVNGIKAINYVTKYVVKDQDFQSVVDAKLLKLSNLFGEDSNATKRFLEKAKCCRPFFKTSTHFGESALKLVSKDFLLSGKIWIDDSKTVRKELGLGMYYKRKLFYNLIKTPEGKYHWELNELGKEYLIKTLDERISRTAERFKTIADNANVYATDILPEDGVKDLIKFYLGNRTWIDFAKYVLVYKGHKYNHNLRKKELPNYEKFYRLSITSTKKTKSKLYDSDDSVRRSARANVGKFTINERSFIQFYYFDRLLLLLSIFCRDFNSGKQNLYNFKEELNSKYKLLKK